MASSSVSLAHSGHEHGGRGAVQDPTGAGAEHHARQPPVAGGCDDQEVDAIAVAGHAVHHRGLGEASSHVGSGGIRGARQRVGSEIVHRVDGHRVAALSRAHRRQHGHGDETRAAPAWRAIPAATRATARSRRRRRRAGDRPNGLCAARRRTGGRDRDRARGSVDDRVGGARRAPRGPGPERWVAPRTIRAASASSAATCRRAPPTVRAMPEGRADDVASAARASPRTRSTSGPRPGRRQRRSARRSAR